jgi:hypothetical protein
MKEEERKEERRKEKKKKKNGVSGANSCLLRFRVIKSPLGLTFYL